MTQRITAEQYQDLVTQGRANKYRAVRVEVDGYKFDSQAEAHRYGLLLWAEQAGEISGLRIHPRYMVFERDDETIEYVADFEYRVPGQIGWVVEDVKGGRATITEAAKIKHKLFRATHHNHRLRLVDKDGNKV